MKPSIRRSPDVFDSTVGIFWAMTGTANSRKKKERNRYIAVLFANVTEINT
jgi:hypothetical protein